MYQIPFGAVDLILAFHEKLDKHYIIDVSSQSADCSYFVF